MKKSSGRFLLLFALGLTSFTACGSDKDSVGKDSPVVAESMLILSQESYNVGPEATTLQLTVKAGSDWEIVPTSDWITVRPSGGVKNEEKRVEISVAANSGPEARTGKLEIIRSGQSAKSVTVVQGYDKKATASASSLTFGAQSSSSAIKITSNCDWSLKRSDSWISVTPDKGGKGETEIEVTVGVNDGNETRECRLLLSYGEEIAEIKVSQLSDAVNVPEGYRLVWSDEFNTGATLGSDWTHEVKGSGWVNNELQNYVNGQVNGRRVTELENGILKINCFKEGGKIYSGRVYAKVNTGWLYGYFEARMNLPKGKGTWPAFWMMPVGNDWATNPWPKCGEIDIMEEVGTVPDEVSSSIHTQNYNHTNNTQKTHAMKISEAEGGWHVYAAEWTESSITTYVDGKVQLKVTKDQLGSDHNSWPFHYAFYPIFNLAWGGSWGGMNGVDESALPVTLQIDYIRVFQKE